MFLLYFYIISITLFSKKQNLKYFLSILNLGIERSAGVVADSFSYGHYPSISTYVDYKLIFNLKND